jgi:hypothetical protein
MEMRNEMCRLPVWKLIDVAVESWQQANRTAMEVYGVDANVPLQFFAVEESLKGFQQMTRGLYEDDLINEVARGAFGVLQSRALAISVPRIILKTLVIAGDKTKEGTLVKGVTALWFEVIRLVENDPDSIHRIDCWKWEEILAGAYKLEGRDKVILTPKKGDKGIDVIVEWQDKSQLRFLLLDQMKAYKPRHLIGPDEIREMKGVLLDHPEASKALITTTADFTPGAFEAAAHLAPRLELRPRDRLLTWLVSVAVDGPLEDGDTCQPTQTDMGA